MREINQISRYVIRFVLRRDLLMVNRDRSEREILNKLLHRSYGLPVDA